MTLLVDATTAQHAVGIRVVIDQLLAALANCGSGAVVAHGPDTDVGPTLAARQVRSARTNGGRLLFQRLALPYYVSSPKRFSSPIDALLLMDAYVPHTPLHGLKCTCYVHDVLPLTAPAYWPIVTRIVKRTEFAALRRADVQIVTSTTHNAAAIHTTIAREAAVVPYGCGQLDDHSADRLLERGPGPRSSTIVYIGALDPRKNVIPLLSAFRKARTALPQEAELLVIGRPRDRGGYAIRRAVTESQDIGVRYIPHVSRQQALDAIDRAGAVVLPSDNEGFGLPVLEALACGTPVVAADIPAIRAWAGAMPIYADPRDPHRLAAALVAAFDRAASDLAAGQEFARAFRWSRFATQLVDIASNQQH